ncbi:AraC-like ligand-binding domain-containing protein [Pseudonocardia asaccharolytica]|uniref:AraC-like ligand-binding domain-containing protein n=1 Tax=Pseudonocardia asaccharolytica TaxID=54010 RepID=UPI001B7F829C
MYWTTADHPIKDQLGYWADVVCEAFTPLAPARTRRHLARSRHTDGMRGWVRSAPLSSTSCAEIASCTQLLTHGNTEVHRSPADMVFVNLQLTGTCRGEQDGRQCVVAPGDLRTLRHDPAISVGIRGISGRRTVARVVVPGASVACCCTIIPALVQRRPSSHCPGGPKLQAEALSQKRGVDQWRLTSP